MRVRLDLAYDGAGFHGWATQPGLRTVQDSVEQALATVLRLDAVALTCAGRTDAGVHARGQVVHADLPDEILPAVAGRRSQPPLDVLVARLNGLLDEDVRVQAATRVSGDFDARFSASWRRYAYRVQDGRPGDPLRRRHVVDWSRPLDLAAMNQAADGLLGEHDFAAYCRRREGATTIRTLQELRWDRDETGVAVGTVRADAFCHSMVRALVGALVAVGEGRRPVAWPAEVLAAGRREPAVRVMPARGLVLEEVGYPPAAQQGARARETRATRGRPR